LNTLGARREPYVTLGDGPPGPRRIQARAVVGHLDHDLGADSP
jgi:hypothetical protein